MSRFANTITLVLMGVFVYFAMTWIQPLKAELGFQFYLLIGIIAAGANTIAAGLVRAALLAKQYASGATS